MGLADSNLLLSISFIGLFFLIFVKYYFTFSDIYKQIDRKMTKIQQLLTGWPRGALRLSKELERKGIGRQLLASYKESGWVESFDHGVYKLTGDFPDWMGAVYALQQMAGSTHHPGGKTALQLKGFSHYIGTGNETNFLFMNHSDTNYRWLDNFENVKTVHTSVFDYHQREYFSSYSAGSFDIFVPVPELAVLEMLYLTPDLQSFDEAGKIIELLYSLRPKLLQRLLEECRSVKIVRLLLFFADYYDHPWLKELDQSKLNIGSGNRLIVKDGILSPKYRITIPREYGSETV